jgi:hypothetical protein
MATNRRETTRDVPRLAIVRRRGLRLWASLAISLIIVGFLIGRVDVSAALRVVARMGLWTPLILAPYLFVHFADVLSWRQTFEDARGPGVRFLWRARLCAEALANSLPAGAALAETVKVVLLTRGAGLPIAKAASNLLVAKLTTGIAQLSFVFMGLVLARRTLQARSVELIGRPHLETWSLVAAGSLLILLSGTLLALARGVVASRLLALVRRGSNSRWRARLERLERPFADFDYGMAAAARIPRRQLARAIAFAFLSFLFLGLETFGILWLLSADVSLQNALSMEAFVSIVRVLFFFLPAGLGAQEASYYAFLRACGVAEAETLTAAFMIAKRAKELAWIGTGYVLLSLQHVKLTDLRSGTADRPDSKP